MRYVDTKADRPRYRVNLFRRITPRLQLGVEWNPGVTEFNFAGNWIVTPETERYPMVSLGTSSDRIFSPEGAQAYFATFAKSFPNLRIAPYIGVSYSEWEETVLFPFGINYSLAPQWDLLGMNDGRNSHVLLTYKLSRSNVTLMLIKMRYPGVSVGFSF